MPRGRSAAIDATLTIGSAAGRLEHRGNRVLRCKEHAVDVDLHHALPHFRILLDDAALAADADVVVEQVEPAELFERRFDHRAALTFVGDIGGVSRGIAAFVDDHLDRALREIELPIDYEHACTRTSKQDRGGATVADAVARGAAAGHDSDLACEAELFFEIHWSYPISSRLVV